MKTGSDRIIIVGGGLGGLAAACVLGARGYQVTLLERNEWFGGKAAEWSSHGFRFDMGPTILTLPGVLRRIFAEAGLRLETELDLVRLDPQWRSFFSDQSVLDLHAGESEMMEEINAFSPGTGSAEGYRRFLKLSERLHDISDRYFFWKSIGGLRDMMDLKNSFSLKTLGDVMAMRMGSTVGGTLRKYVPDARVSQMLDHFTQYVGSAPDNSPAVLCGIAHMQTDCGVWYPMGGTRAVPEALARLARRLGVDIRLGCGVKRILHQDGEVTGVETESGETVSAAAVVSNCDAVRTFRELIGGQEAATFESRRSYEPACSGVVFYWGLNRRYDHLLHHNFVFSRDPHEEFEAIYREGKPAPDPTCYVCAPSCTEPGVAPEGGEALYVLVHTPYLRKGQDWKQMLPGYRKVILEKLAKCGGMKDLESRIVCERALTPQDIHERYSVLNGAIYGLASHGRLLGAFKPGNRVKSMRGLYLSGGAAHPGPGMPMVMMSGWIAADSLDQDQVVRPVRSPSTSASRESRAGVEMAMGK